MKRLSALAIGMMALACAAQQGTPECPAPADVTHLMLVGTWRAEIEGRGGATLQLEQHPTYGESVRGTLSRGDQRAVLAGDIDDGDLTLEESNDGRHISATWLGEPVEGACGREIRGTWKAEGEPLAHPFVMRKVQPPGTAPTAGNRNPP